MLPAFFASVVELITETSTNLPPDVRAAMARALAGEDRASRAGQALAIIAQNIDQAESCEGPICQDTGMPTFEVRTPVGANQIWMRARIREAVAEATRRGKLRPNSVDSITGKNSGNNLGPGTPIVHFEQWERPDIEIRLVLKGGGCENTNAQYSVPVDLDHLGRADRTLEGVRKCILHAVWQAQGKGCSPGAIGVCIGGDRTSGYLHAKEQLFRSLDDVNPDARLAQLENEILADANRLSIGPMAFSGRTSHIGSKIGTPKRLAASFLVSIAYDCWAFRRLGVTLDAETGAITSWLYRDPERPVDPMVVEPQEGFTRTGREVLLRAPISEEQARALKVGDVVLISGRMYTGRDAVHAHLVKHDPPVDLNGGVLYHCGPVVVQNAEREWEWHVTAAGPTTSIREEPYQADLIQRYGIRVVIVKGGMGPRTLAALKEAGAVYVNAIGGAAQFYARCIERVTGVSFVEFGTPEAMWHLEAKDFPGIVTMDSHGNSLHHDVEVASGQVLETLQR